MAGNTPKTVNDQKVRSMPPGSAPLVESLPGRGTGALLFKRPNDNPPACYYRYHHAGKSVLVKLGTYRMSARDAGLTLPQLRARATELARLMQEHGDLKAYLEQRRAASELEQQEAARQIRKHQHQAEIEARKGTFAELLDAYTDDLERNGKVSHRKARQLFKSHVTDHHPDLVARKAAEIQPEDIQQILAAVLQRQPKGRGIGNKAQADASNGMKTTTDELRRYLKAAFNFAAKSHLSAERIAESGKLFAINSNPVALIPAIKGTKGGDTEALHPDELAALLRHLDSLPERQQSIARACLYLGGQRLRQLLSIDWQAVADDRLALVDSKGRKASAWEHLLPITPRLQEIMQPLLAQRSAPGPFSLDGQNSIHPDTVTKLFSYAGRTLHKAGKTRFAFTWRHLRATCETLLAAQGVSQEVRAWLLSHGRTGVQAKHYDRFGYLPEKQAALEHWGRYLDGLHSGEHAGKVVVLSQRKRSQ